MAPPHCDAPDAERSDPVSSMHGAGRARETLRWSPCPVQQPGNGVTTLPTELETVGRLVLAAVLGYLIGLERESAGQAAGERTHALVALGSAAFALLSITAFPGSDSSRVAAGVVTGLGFLGAGTILKGEDTRVRGLTTAAGIWTEPSFPSPRHPHRAEH